MEKVTLKRGDKVNCPHCGKELEGLVEDYTVQGTLGLINPENKNDCGWCDRLFIVKRLRDNEHFEVYPTAGTYTPRY